MYRNICAENEPQSKWDAPPLVGMTELILWDFQVQTDKQVTTNQLDIVVVNKQQKAVLILKQPAF